MSAAIQRDSAPPSQNEAGRASAEHAARRPTVVVVAVFAIAFMAITALADVVRRPDAALVKDDFVAFYCGSLVSQAHRDPYALSPIWKCERQRVDSAGGLTHAETGIDPDPFPAYHMAFFAPQEWRVLGRFLAASACRR